MIPFRIEPPRKTVECARCQKQTPIWATAHRVFVDVVGLHTTVTECDICGDCDFLTTLYERAS